MNTETKVPDKTEMGLFEHLGELRQRIIVAFISVLICAIIAYSFSSKVLDLLFEPFFANFDRGMLIGTGPAEAFILKLKVAFFCGIILSCPVLFLQVWLFIAPGLYDNEKRLVIPFVFFTSFLFLLGISFCYEFVLPVAFEFFKQQYDSIAKVTPAIRVEEHLSLMLQALIGFGLVFEMPVIAFFLGRVGIIDHKMMISGFRYAVVLIFVIAAILTPPDVLSQFLMAIPLVGLYGLSILIVKYTEQKPISKISE
jgi:sec-independent protein translocase protein TatC